MRTESCFELQSRPVRTSLQLWVDLHNRHHFGPDGTPRTLTARLTPLPRSLAASGNCSPSRARIAWMKQSPLPDREKW
jgi:hypothetical protein